MEWRLLAWLQKNPRTPFDAHSYSLAALVTSSGYSASTFYREWWPYKISKGGARDGTTEPETFDG